MLHFFFKPKKTAESLVRKTRDGLHKLDAGGPRADSANVTISKNLLAIKTMIYGAAVGGAENDFKMSQLTQSMYSTDLLLLLIKNLHRIQFEAKKDVVQVFNNVLIRELGSRLPTVDYICSKPDILYTLLDGYQHRVVAFCCGTMLRECARYEPLAKILLQSKEFYDLFDYIGDSSFDISSDAFSTFCALLTNHKPLCGKFLDDDYELFFSRYELLLKSPNYVTRRQSLKLLGELLITPHNYNMMQKYITNPNNLQLIMMLLTDRARYIQFEAFNVFKVFVANPKKPKPILKILLRNQQRLVRYLTEFLPTMTEDEQFLDEKAYVIEIIQKLKPVMMEK
ncbi:protein Mo25-like [Anopheles maculipalpis]|uniref:protein Mo25-like n=1 Tax=Anopheles maculipalpis TaxID=1496333 RepID=UPI0021599129|nr:protein Mo25-like [Anopheles maculipalpis]